jgi:hypothetical protein
MKDKCIGLHCYDQYNKDYQNLCPDFDIYPTIIDHKKTVIAIGDIHGDMDLAIKFLKIASLIEEVTPNLTQNIKEYQHTIIINSDNSIGLKENIQTYNDNYKKNNYELVYRYYEINNQFYVRVILEDKIIKWFKWIGEDTYVVQVGDQVDRCRPYGNLSCDNKNTTKDDEDSDLEIMLFYDSLDRIAKKYNGRVFSLLGNHEIMNITEDMRYVSYKGLTEYSPDRDINDGLNIRTDKFKTIISKKMACTRSTVLVIGDYLFVHGGIAKKLAFNYKLFDINSIIRKYLHDSSSLINHRKKLRDLLNSSNTSPLWYRKLAYIPMDINGKENIQCKTLFNPIIKEINKYNNEEISNVPIIHVKGMVIGHTPQFVVFGTGITTACNDKLIRADIGASKAFDIFENNNINNESRKPQVVKISTNLYTKVSSVMIIK